jgi:hypothetical protein
LSAISGSSRRTASSGEAQLASGSWIESEVEHLSPELLSEIEERNARGRLDAAPGE